MGPWGMGTLGPWVSLGLVSCSRRHQPGCLEHLPGDFTSPRRVGRCGSHSALVRASPGATPKPHISLPALHILGFLFLKQGALLGWLWIGSYSTAHGSLTPPQHTEDPRLP